jgi:ribosome recycling factor
MSFNPTASEIKQRMEKCLHALQGALAKVRTGRASLSILDGIKVEYYGNLSPLNQVATLGVPESRLITIAPWDPKVIPDIEKAIQKSDLGLTPANDGKVVRLPIPPLTEERRRDLVKLVKKEGEEGKVAIRHVRREAMEALKKMEKDGELSKDDHKHRSDEVEKITHEYVEKADQLVVHKEKELMEV